MIEPKYLLELGDVIETMCSDEQEIQFEIFAHEEFYNNRTGAPLPKNRYCKHYYKTEEEICRELDEKAHNLIFSATDIVTACCNIDLNEFKEVHISENKAEEIIDEIWGSAVGYINAKDNILEIVLFNVRPSSLIKFYKMCKLAAKFTADEE